MSINPGNVSKALKELQESLPAGMPPNEMLVKVMIDKITAEIRMTTMLEEYQQQWKKATATVVKAQQALKTQRGSTSSATGGYPAKASSPTRSTASWEQVTNPPSPERQLQDNIFELLTTEEKERLMQVVSQRMTAAVDPNTSDVELEPDYARQ